MSFMQGFSQKVKSMAQNVAKKSGDMVEVTKINLSISTEEENIKKLCLEIGKHCYKMFEENEKIDSTVSELCEKIKAHMDTIESLKEKINEVKNVVVCKECGNEISRDGAFCGKCGAKIEIKEAESEPTENDSEEKVEDNKTVETETDTEASNTEESSIIYNE